MNHKYTSPEKFARDHKIEINDILQEEYMRLFDRTYHLVKCSWDFGGLIGGPLFIVFMILICNSTMEWYWVLEIVVALGLLMRWFAKHTVKITCLELFSHRKEKAMDKYLAHFIEDEINQYPDEADEIEKFYKSVKRELEWMISIDINQKKSGR